MKALLKRAANGLATLLVLPAYLFYQVASLIMGPDRAFPGWSQAISLVPGFIGIYLRRAFYRLTLTRCGEDVVLGFGTVFSHPSAALGHRVYVGNYCSLGGITLEDDVLLASNVSVMNGGRQHGYERLDIPIREQQGVWMAVTVGRDSWVGERTTILADVGARCVIGAGSVVYKPVPDFSVAIGVPACVIRSRHKGETAVR
jgi:virginiamycin A acetyltransferase